MSEEKALDSCDECCQPKDIVDVFELINNLNKKYEKLQRDNIQELELTPTQHFILSQLWESDSQQFKELAEKCGCSRSTITGVVDTMEKKELVSRKLNLDDRRSLLVILTEKGKALKKITPPLEAIVNGCCPEINQEEMKKLGELLQKLLNSLKF
ncbi:MAG: MarR family transcriptional regulator [Candidatus Lokiarchaeota archaeon]|nr:MarR family transcriptional regulator [Candidatus Lokiarchaeota archaeon]